MASKAIANSTLVLRIFTLLFLAASIVLMATNTVKFFDGSQSSWKDIIAYRYVIATAMVGFVYTALQIPFAIYYVCTEKRLTRHDCLPEFDFYGDKVMSFLLATGVGAGFAIGFELKRLLNGFADTSLLDRGNLATGILLGDLSAWLYSQYFHQLDVITPQAKASFAKAYVSHFPYYFPTPRHKQLCLEIMWQIWDLS